MKVKLGLQTVALSLVIVLWSGIVYGSSLVDGEVLHLLAYIKESGCTFYRNGKEYGSEEAQQHIERKYNHVKKKIATAEHFIRYAATKSSLTGKPYTVVCDGVESPSSEWLTRELEKYRTGKGS